MSELQTHMARWLDELVESNHGRGYHCSCGSCGFEFGRPYLEEHALHCDALRRDVEEWMAEEESSQRQLEEFVRLSERAWEDKQGIVNWRLVE